MWKVGIGNCFAVWMCGLVLAINDINDTAEWSVATGGIAALSAI